METKICTKCSERKNISEFTIIHPKDRNGVTIKKPGAWCRICYNKHKTEYRRKSDSYREYIKKYNEINKDHLKEVRSLYRKKNKARLNKIAMDWYYKNTDKIKLYRNRYWLKLTESISDRYVLHQLSKRTGIDFVTLRKYPDLIEAKRLTLKAKRLCKTSES